MGHTCENSSHLLKWVKLAKVAHTFKKWVILGQIVHTLKYELHCKNGSLLHKWITDAKWVTLAEMGYTCKNG